MLRTSTSGVRGPALSNEITLHGTHRNRRAAFATLKDKLENAKPTQAPKVIADQTPNTAVFVPKDEPNQNENEPAQGEILFDRRIAVPYVHELQHNRKLICPDCSTTQTEHYCDGSTAHTSTLCPKHEHLDSLYHSTDECTEDTGRYSYDQDEFSKIQELLMHGELRAPAKQLIRVGEGSVNTGKLSKMELRRIKEQQELERFLPGCAPNKQDWGVRQAAPMGFRPVDGESYAFQRVWPVQPVAQWSHAPGCASSDTPEFILATRDEVLAFRQFSAVMYRNEYERQDWCCAGKGRGKKCRPCRESAIRWFDMAIAPGWAIGVFLKRCNGMYINALGYMKDGPAGTRLILGGEDADESEDIATKTDFVCNLEFSARTLLAKEEGVASGRLTEKQCIQDSWRRRHVIDRERERREKERDWEGMLYWKGGRTTPALVAGQ